MVSMKRVSFVCDWWWIAAVWLVEANKLVVVIDSSDSFIQDCIASPFIPHRRPNGDSLPAIASSFRRIFLNQQALISTAKWSRNGYSVAIWVKVRTNVPWMVVNPTIMRTQWVYHLHLAGIASWLDHDTPWSRFYLAVDFCLQYHKSYGQMPTQWGHWVLI